MGRECTAISHDTEGNMTLPRQTTPSSKHKQKSEGIASREGSSSLFDLSNIDLRQSSGNISSSKHKHSSIPHLEQNHHQSQSSDYPQRKGAYGSNCREEQMQQQQEQRSSPQITADSNSPHGGQHSVRDSSQRQMGSSDQLTPFSIVDSCPPEFQNEGVPLPDPPPPPRITGHVYQRSPCSTPPSVSQHSQLSSFSHEHKYVSTPSPPQGHQHTSTIHQHHRPRQYEKRVTIVEEGIHRL